MKFGLAILGAFVLAGAVLYSARLLLPACGLSFAGLPDWLYHCDDGGPVRDRLAAVDRANADLLLRIAARERELSLIQCAPQGLPALPPIDREAWVERDIGLLEGCWELDSRFSTRAQGTGAVSQYTTWRMCFDAAGNGTEEMLADNGNVCRGAVRGSFDTSGALTIEEPGNLQCSDGGFIYRLVSRCTLNANGTASCAVTQPEPGSSTTVEFRRATGSN